MNRPRLWIAGGVMLAAVVIGVVSIGFWKRERRYVLTEQTPLIEIMNARPPRHGALSAVSVDIDLASRRSGVVTLDVRRTSTGRTDPSYAWDWKGALSADVSIIDITRQAQRDEAVSSWDVEMETPGRMRLKIWREWRNEWRAVAESPVVATTPGLNHLVLNPALPIRAGDYVGLYVMSGRMRLVSPLGGLPVPDLQDQSATNLTWATARGLQYDVPGDVACVAKAAAQPAPNPGYAFEVFFDRTPVPAATPADPRVASTVPLTVLDLEKEMGRDEVLRSWEVVADASSMLRLKIWRREGADWSVVGQSGLEHAHVGLNRFSLTPGLPVRTGDVLGFFTDYPQSATQVLIPFPVQIDTCSSGAAGKMYALGDFNGRIAAASLAHDSVGRYAFRALAQDLDHADSEPVTLQLQQGRRNYRLPIPAVPFAIGDMVTLTLRAAPGITLTLHSSSEWLHPEYGAPTRSWATMLVDFLLVGLSLAGAWAMIKRQQGRTELVWAGGLLLAAAAVWLRWASGSPIALLAPGIVLMLMLPGFVILELVMPQLPPRLDSFERAPLLFGLSMVAWVVIAAMAYRAHWPTSALVSGLLVCGAICLGALFWIRGRRPVEVLSVDLDPAVAFSTKAYRVVLIAVILMVMMGVAWRAQFQGTGSDTIAHLAGYRKIADSATITGGNPLLGPGYTYLANYGADPWYLAFGLVARTAHASTSVPLLYVCLTSLLTGLVFLAFYSLLKAFTCEALSAALGTLMAVGPWLLSYAAEWKGFHSYFFEFLGYPSTFTDLILFPLLTAYALHFAREGLRPVAVMVALLSVAAMGMHPQYVVFVPLLIGTALIASSLTKSGRPQRRLTAGVVALIACAAVALVYLAAPGSYSDRTAWSVEKEVGLWTFDAGPHGLWRPTTTLISHDPIGIFDHGTEMVGLAALLILGGRRVLIGKRSIQLTHTDNTTGSIGRVALAAGLIMGIPWFVAFDPLVATPLFYLFHSAIPIVRIIYGNANTALMYASIFGAIAVAWSALIRTADTSLSRRLVHVVPLLLLACAMGVVGVSPSGRQSLLAPLANQGWYPSLLDLPNDSLYRGLSQLKPGIVAVASEEAELVAALTPHYVVSVRQFRIGDSKVTAQRMADNDAILNFTLPLDQLREVLQRVRCRYVVVPRGSAAIASFRRSPQLFSEVFSAEADVVFRVNGA
jgi:hypothetical protein